MSGNNTIKMLGAYYQDATPALGFTGMFQARPEGFHDSEEVEIDIMRSEEDIAIVITDLTTGKRWNNADDYTNKKFTPPVFYEAAALNSYDLLKRMPGSTPFDNPNFRASVITQAFRVMRLMEAKIRRSLELQCAQIMQTGTVTLSDKNGNALYSINFLPKSSHFPTAGVSWSTATLAQKLADLDGLADQIQEDGLADPDLLVFGKTAWTNLLGTTGFKEHFDLARADLGRIVSPQDYGAGMKYHGEIVIGDRRMGVLTYNKNYTDPQTGNPTKYMDDGKVVCKASNARLDLTFGGIPNIGQLLGVSRPIMPELNRRFSSARDRMDLTTNVWLNEDGTVLNAGVGGRPMAIPVAIDRFGCLNTQL